MVVSQPRRQRGCLKASNRKKEKKKKMKSKKLITLLVLTTMLLAMVPMVPVAKADLVANDIDITNDSKSILKDSGEKGNTIILEGDPGSVASGYEVLVYWNKLQAWDGVKGHLNTTEADNDGGFEIWFKVPEAPVGSNYLWFEATDQEGKVSKTFTVVSDCDISTSSGLAGSKILVDLWGYAKNKEVAILFMDDKDYLTENIYAKPFDEIAVDLYESDEDDYDGTLLYDMIQPGTVNWDIGDAVDLINDDKDDTATPNGNLWWYDDDAEGTPPEPKWVDVGNINYVTGEWSLDLGAIADIPDGAEMDVSYCYIVDEPNKLYVLTSAGVTTNLGSWTNKRVTIPTGIPKGPYYVVGFDGKNNQANADFTIGAVITLSTDEGDVGDKIEINGEGFPENELVTCAVYRSEKLVNDVHIIGSGETGYKTDGGGEFEFEIIIPGVTKKDDDYEIKVLVLGVEAAADFDVTGLASVSADPEYGPQGSSITVSGKNFQKIKDKKVKIMLYDGTIHIADIKDNVKVDSDGSFKVNCIIPTENDGSYKIKVEDIGDADGRFHISDTIEFRIGTIMVLLSKEESVVGDRIVLSGNGFTKSGEWNATFGDVTIFIEEQASTNGLLKVSDETPQFFVPQVQPGEYTITVWDVDAEISVETDFTVTEYTVLEFDLFEAPNEFNVSINGWNWPWVDENLNYEDEIEFVLFNETDDWDMDVRMFGAPSGGQDNSVIAYLNETGFLNDAWWFVPDSETLSKGKYWVNATLEADNDQEYFMQFEFVVSDIHMYSAPRKTTFRITETVNFKIQHTFGNDPNHEINGGDIKVYDPDGELYWDGDKLETWSKVETWYECPTSSQTASSNPMILLDDAPIGTWTYKWRDKTGDVIAEGTFNVETSEADILTRQIDDLNQAINDLTDDITGVSEAVAGVQTNVQSAIQASQAAVDAANKAIEAVNAVAGTAGDAAKAADKAAEAALKAQESASGLTTLVYGAIGASLVAALAAIVSLMQISKRIAG